MATQMTSRQSWVPIVRSDSTLPGGVGEWFAGGVIPVMPSGHKVVETGARGCAGEAAEATVNNYGSEDWQWYYAETGW